MKRRLLVTTALVGLTFVSASPAAFAACDDNTPTNGQTVTCTPNDNVGISASGQDVTINVNNNTTIHPAAPGDDAFLIGSGLVQIGGDSTIQSDNAIAIHADNPAINTRIATGNNVQILGGTYGIYLEGHSTVLYIGPGSTVTGSGGTAIRVGASSATASTVTINSSATINGDVIAGAGASDELVYEASTSNNFDTDQYQGFEIFTKTSGGTTTLLGTSAQNWTIEGGTLSTTDTANIANVAVDAGATLDFDNVDGTYADDVSGAGDWDIRNGSNLTLSGNNTGFTGLLDIDGSNNIAFNDANALTSGDIRVNFSTVHFGDAMTATNDFTIGAGDATFNTGANSVTISGDISGTGGALLVKDGSGTLTLTGTNTYDGGIVISQGRLIGDTDSLIGDVSNGGTLQFNQAFDATFAGDIAGTGALEKLGAGNLTLSGTNTYQGGTDVQAGTLTGTTSSLQGLINNNAAVVFDQAGNGTYSGTMSGTGSFTKEGAGTVTLSGANSYSGATTIAGGTLSVSASNNLGDESATNDLIFNNGSLTYTAAFDQTRDVTLNGTGGAFNTGGFNVGITGDVDGSGVLQKNQAGTLTITGNLTNTGNTIINAGTLELVDASTRTYNGIISGSGNLILSGTGTLTLGGASTYSGTTTLSGGQTVRISAANNLGNGASTNDIIMDGGTLAYTGNVTQARDILLGVNDGTIDTNGNIATLSGNITGATGRLIKAGAGELILTGTNTYGDGTLINLGTITGDTESIVGDYNLAIGGVVMNFDQTHNGTYAGQITGAGNLEKRGTGTVTLTGDNSGLTGFTNIYAGKLTVNGDMNDSWTNVLSGATLGGTGRVQYIDNSGTIAPGVTSIGTLNVDDAVVFRNGSHYAVQYTTTPNDSDKIIAGGAITINAGAILDLTGTNGNYFADTNYTILSGSSVTGGFTTVNNNLVFLDVDFDDSTATDLIMTLTRNNTSFADILNEDEEEFANAFDDLANDLTTAFTNLTAEQAQDAADQLSNEQQGATTTFASTVNANILTNISNRMGHSFSSDLEEVASRDADDGTFVSAYMEPAAGGTFDRDTNLWFKAIGSKGATDSSASEPSQDRYSYGALAGIDRALDDKGFYGFFAGYEFGEVETESQHASSKVDNYHAGAYMSRPVAQGFIFNTGAAFTYHIIDSVRYVSFPGFDAAPRSDTHGYSASGFVELSKPMKAQLFDFAPFVNLALAHTKINGYTEQGGGLANLVVEDTSVTNPISVLGARFSADQQWGDTSVNLFASLGWQHVVGEIQPETSMRFANGAAFFDTDGAPRARDAALISMGIDANISQMVNAFAGYNASISGSNIDHGIELGVKVKF